MTFDEILLSEPDLIHMIYEANSLKHCPWSVKNTYWYKILKPKMIKIVGFSADDQSLATTEAYELVYQFFIKLMDM